MSTEILFLVTGSEQEGFVASASDHAIFTQADDLGELHEMVKDAVACHFDAEDVPATIRLRFVREGRN